MGGHWEVPIKLIKRTLKAFTRDRLFTEDALDHFFFFEVEAILNNDPSQLQATISIITKH